jgi:uncharacterized protein with von Willebrand factor type A (vWA) domain
MDERIVGFIEGLRQRGVRVSVAESQDALAAAQAVGVRQRGPFRVALKSTLIKQRSDSPTFDELFPLYFGLATGPRSPADEGLSEAGQRMLERAFAQWAGQLRAALERAVDGRPFTNDDLRAAAERAGMGTQAMMVPGWFQRRLQQELHLVGLLREIRQLLGALAALGMDPADLKRLAEGLRVNQQALQEQAQRYGARQLLEAKPTDRRHRPSPAALADRPFGRLSADEQEILRHQVARLANRLRTRWALRQRRGDGPRLDAKATLRASLRTNGVPFELIRRRRRKRARFALICDVSTSMRPVVTFLLLLMYQVQAEVSRTRSFAFIDHMIEISPDFEGDEPRLAIDRVLTRIHPGHYNTDLGRSLAGFLHRNPTAVDRRTTVVICGDGRNNYNDPRLDLIEQLRRRAHRLVWFNPEPSYMWGGGDSDMKDYAPLADQVFQVSNLRQLSRAVDQILR